MHTLDTIKASAAAGTVPDANGGVVRGSITDLHANFRVLCLYNAVSAQYTFIVNGRVVDEATAAREIDRANCPPAQVY